MDGAELRLGTGGARMGWRLCGKAKSLSSRPSGAKLRWLAYGALAVALCGGIVFVPLICQPVLAQQVATNPYAGDPEAIEEAGKMYGEICSHCHGFAGEGGIGGSINDSRWVKASSDRGIFMVIARGRKNTQMTPYEALGEDMIWKLVGYMRKLQEDAGGKEAPKPSPQVAARQAEAVATEVPSEPVPVQQGNVNPYAGDPEAIEEAGKMYGEICSHCHGFAGEGGIGGSINDSRWVKASSDRAIFMVIARGRKNTQMTPYEALGEDMIWKLVGYMRKLQEDAGAQEASKPSS